MSPPGPTPLSAFPPTIPHTTFTTTVSVLSGAGAWGTPVVSIDRGVGERVGAAVLGLAVGAADGAFVGVIVGAAVVGMAVGDAVFFSRVIVSTYALFVTPSCAVTVKLTTFLDSTWRANEAERVPEGTNSCCPPDHM